MVQANLNTGYPKRSEFPSSSTIAALSVMRKAKGYGSSSILSKSSTIEGGAERNRRLCQRGFNH